MDEDKELEIVGEKISVRYDIDRSELPSTTVIMTVADAMGVEPDALPPLYDTVEPDALDDIFLSAKRAARDVLVAFSFNGCEVTVESNGVITVELQDETRSSRPV